MADRIKKDGTVYLKMTVPNDTSGYVEVAIVPEEDLHYQYGGVRDGRIKIYRVTAKEEVDLKFEILDKPKQ